MALVYIDGNTKCLVLTGIATNSRIWFATGDTTTTTTTTVAAYPAGLISYWSMNELSGNLTDSVSSYTGVATSLAYGATGIIRSAVTFNGTSSKVIVGASGTGFPKPTTAFSFSFWIKTTDAGDKRWLYAYSSTYGMIGYYGASGTGKIELLFGDGTNSHDAVLTTSVNTGNWVHVAITFDGTNVLGYVNGSGCYTSTWAYDVGWTGVNEMTIGANNYGSGFISASLDEFGVFDHALTSAEVSQIYNSGSGLAP